MSNKKLKGFKFSPELIARLSKAAKTFKQSETTIVEASLTSFLDSKEDQQREVIKKYLTKNL